MVVVEKKALILKASEGTDNYDSYERKFAELGFQAEIVSPIEFEFCNLDSLKIMLSNPSLYSGIVFTSPRSVKAVLLTLQKGESLASEWQSCPIFVVGEATHQSVYSLLGLSAEGRECGSAKELADNIAFSSYTLRKIFLYKICGWMEYILHLDDDIACVNLLMERKFEKPLLFPCGNLKTDTLTTTLKGKGISIEDIVVYRTCEHSELGERVKEVVNRGIPEFIIFFSPSGVKYTVPLLNKLSIPWESIKVVCIGPTTEAAVKEHGLKVSAVSKKPTADFLIEAILNT